MKTRFRTHVSDGAREVLAALWKAFACARDLKIDPWEFSLPLLHLVDRGVDTSDLRWLVLRGYVTFSDRGRRLQPGTKVVGGSDPRFLITEAGTLVARPGTAYIVTPYSNLPHWDRRLRELLFDGCVVKRYRLPASNQEAVLSAFEEESWPPSIDDPLPFLREQRSKRRLHETIRHLNANHQNRLIRFRGNGTGEAVLWEPIASAVDRPTVTLEMGRAA